MDVGSSFRADTHFHVVSDLEHESTFTLRRSPFYAVASLPQQIRQVHVQVRGTSERAAEREREWERAVPYRTFLGELAYRFSAAS